MFNSFAPLDILVLAAIAAVVLYRLYKQFGSHVDVHDAKKSQQDAFVAPESSQGTVTPLFSPQETAEDDEEEASNRYAELLAYDPDFQEKDFLEGASMAFEMIVNAHALGDNKTLKPLLSSTLFDDFCAEIKRRRQEKHHVELEIIGINRMEINSVRLDESLATLVVEIESEQIYAVYDDERNMIEGQAEELQTVYDTWHFQRDLRMDNLNWLLVYTEAETEAEAEAEADGDDSK